MMIMNQELEILYNSIDSLSKEIKDLQRKIFKCEEDIRMIRFEMRRK